MKKLLLFFTILLNFNEFLLGQATTPTLLAPSELKATAIAMREVTLTWKDNSNNETGFNIQRSLDNSTFTTVVAVSKADLTTYTVTGLSRGSRYYFRIRAVGTGNTFSAFSNTVDATTLRAPAAPTELKAIAVSTSQINLSWKDNSSDERSNRVERSTNGTTFVEIANLGENVTTFQHTGLTANTLYYYRVRAIYDDIDLGNPASDYSNTANTRTLAPAPPAAPSELTLNPLLIDNKNNVTLRWKDNSNDETGFEIETSTNGSNYTKATTTGANITGYEIYLTTSTKNYFRVRAINGSLQSGYSNVVDYDMGPESPLDLKATAVSASQIDLKWSDRSADETGYDVERSDNGTNFAKIATLGANTTSYSNMDLPANTLYYYRVRGIKSGAGSAYTHVASARTQVAIAPTAPGLENFSQNWTKNSDRVTEITVNWQDKANNETGFDIQWGDNDQYAGGSASVGANSTQHKIEGSWPGCDHKVFVRVRAKNSAGESGWSAGSLTTSLAIPEAPSGVVATAKSSTEIDLKWNGANESFSRESEFIVSYWTAADPSRKTKTVPMNADGVTVTGLTPKTAYSLVVKSKNCKGESPSESNQVSATTHDTPPNPPANLRAAAIRANAVDLQWDDSNSGTPYELQWSQDGTNFSLLATLGANVTKRTATDLKENTAYWFRVRALKGNNLVSEFSNTLKITTSINPPADPTIIKSLSRNWTGNSDKITEITFSWTDNSPDETGFEVQWGTDAQYANGGTKTLSAGTNMFKADGSWAGCGARFFVRVRAVKANLTSAWSTHDEVAEITTPDKPENLVATPKNATEVELKWSGANEPTSRESEFILSYLGMGQAAKEVRLSANTEVYSLSGLQPNTVYSFTLKARNCKGESEVSAAVSAKTPEPPRPAPPTNLRLSAETVVNQISMEWTDVATDETGYEISRAVDSQTTWEILKAALPANSNAFADKPVRSGRKYFYRARTVRNGDFSDYSNVLETIAPIVSAVTVDDPIDWQVYPNPVSETVQVKGKAGVLYSVVLRNAAGNAVLQSTIRSESTLSVSGLPAGVYMLQLATPNQSKIYRLLKRD